MAQESIILGNYDSIVLHSDGTMQVIRDDKRMTLAEMQAAVGGYIEIAYYVGELGFTERGAGDDIDYPAMRAVIVNEEGWLKGLAPNPFASPGAPLAGNILITTII